MIEKLKQRRREEFLRCHHNCTRDNGGKDMKILVCIKQVPDMESKFKVDAGGTWYAKTDLAWRMNEYDEYAVEQAVQLKEQVKDADLTVCVSVPIR